MSLEHKYDCVVVGGGPAGATAATILAQYGRRTAVVERELFPRYHVGESLMPYTWFTFNRLGVLDWFEQAACPKKIQRAICLDIRAGVSTVLFF